MRHGFFRRKNYTFAEKKFCGTKYENKADKNKRVENRAQHASQGHLSALKTDCNSASMPRREIPELLCVCPPGEAPGGNTRHSGVHCVSSCFCSLLVLGPEIFSAKVLIFSAKKTHVAYFFYYVLVLSLFPGNDSGGWCCY